MQNKGAKASLSLSLFHRGLRPQTYMLVRLICTCSANLSRPLESARMEGLHVKGHPHELSPSVMSATLLSSSLSPESWW